MTLHSPGGPPTPRNLPPAQHPDLSPGQGPQPGGDIDLRSLQQQLARLRAMVGGLALVLVGVVLVGAVGSGGSDEVLRAERLEIVEPDGSLAFVLANSARPQVATMDGMQILEGQENERRNPSFIFFDGKGDEVGGMLFRNLSDDDGFSAVRHLSLDGYKQDQTVVLHHYQDPRGSRAGLSVTDRPEGSLVDGFRSLGMELPASRADLERAIADLPEGERQARLAGIFGGAPRAFVGRALDGSAALVLHDGMGRPRIMLGAPDEGDPYIRILNEAGETVMDWPGS